ncbi:mediator of RNA polymerase II transcription subunit 1-like isoform X11 [Chiroxiphia lanceolata]|uniref:mediator of RNA polymerase II transcription subunit 1-like isoform X11 n=1 Tax=Chiroxiphia lanceolata TaxID=296741 RepID=UPI0013CE5D40|nr:mediator of RNA polymerase II transcription subunit 1-like isoform X11 [Chiroxiphia lanceolata]
MSVPPACQLILDLENRRGVSCRGVVTAISTNALMEQLCLKYQQRPWTETLRLVYFCMDNPLRRPVSHAPDSPLLSCMEKIERTLHAKSMFSVMNALESLSRQKGLNVHVSPSGTACYITSMMFYLEVQLEKDGNLMDVKLAHFGEAPVVCDDLVQLLRMKNYDAFGKILEDLSNMYQIPGNSEMKAKGYLALQALEKDLYSMSLPDRTQDVNRVTEILHGKVGHLVPRTRGTPMNIEFYISPYQILEAELTPGSQVCGTKTVVTIEGTDMLHKLPLSPLIVDPQSGEDSNPAFLQLTDELSMDLPALFVLKFHQPVPMSSSSIEDIHRLTVMIDVITSREVHCHLHLNPQDPALSCSDDFIARAVKRRCSLRRREPRALGHNGLESHRRIPASPHPAQTSAELTGLGQAPTRHFTAEQVPTSPEAAALRGAFFLPRPAADAAPPSPRLSAPLTQAPPAAWPLTSVPHRGRQGTSPARCSSLLRANERRCRRKQSGSGSHNGQGQAPRSPQGNSRHLG